ncbi:MAG TPA: DNA translocase FtsK [Firmicutes bacterium]|nr:DNA translocase FtsK [Bacillota bacterium]
MLFLFDELNDDVKNQVKGILFICLAGLMLTGLLFTEKTGEFGLFLNNFLRFLAGEVAIVLPALFFVVGVKVMLPESIKNLRLRLLGILLFLMILMVSAHLNLMMELYEKSSLTGSSLYEASLRMGAAHRGGGMLGAVAAIMLYFFFREIGSYIVLATLTLISFLLVTNLSVTRLAGTMMRAVKSILQTVFNIPLLFKSISRFFFAAPPDKDEYDLLHDETAAAGIMRTEEPPFNENKGDSRLSAADPGLVFNDNATAEEMEGEIDLLEDSDAEADYLLPPLDLLPRVRTLQDPKQQKTISERGKIIETTLKSFGVQAKVCGIHVGPTVTRYELQPETGVKVSKIVNLSNDLALNLAAPGVRIEAPIPGKAAVGIEVPNQIVSLVYLREVLESPEFQENTSPLAIALGKDITGNPVIADLLKMPHLLVAGATGSGKSVCVNIIIASILFKASPKQVRFLMIDPKVVELNIYNGIPHLIAPVITDAKKAAIALKNVLREMGRRYQLFAREGVREITRYNQIVQEEGKGEYLPYYVVIIDELADLMMVAPSDVEDAIARLAQMARAAGIHLVIATQRPSVDVITGVIKANITSRIAFAVSSQTDSRTILDEGGAEKLLGRGDMLFYPVGAPKPFRVQGAFIAESDLQSLVDYVRGQGKEAAANSFIVDEPEYETNDELDELFPEAVRLVVETGQASITLLQRRLRIGYTRAARIIDDMEARGIIGSFEGSKAREVLIEPEQLTDLFPEK